MLLFHHFNVFGYNSTSIVMFVCFYCYLSSAVFFLIYLFVTAKAALPKIIVKKLPGLGSETSKSINKLIGSTKWLSMTIPMNATRPLFSKPGKLKFGLNIKINKSVWCANFGYPRSRDRELRHKKNKKRRLKVYEFAYNSKTTRRAKLKFGRNKDAYKCFMQTEFGCFASFFLLFFLFSLPSAAFYFQTAKRTALKV